MGRYNLLCSITSARNANGECVCVCVCDGCGGGGGGGVSPLLGERLWR